MPTKYIPLAVQKNENQARIIKFTTHSFKENVFLQHKRNKKLVMDKRKKSKTQVPGER